MPSSTISPRSDIILSLRGFLASHSGRGGTRTRDGEGKMNEVQIKKNNKLLENAKELRRNMTPQEKHLWYDFLQNYPVKIYKQRIIDNFIADFYCHQARLVIELDGSQHYTPEGKTYDEARTEVLERYGLHVLRFSNMDIENKFEGVCYMIDKTISERLPSPSACGCHLSQSERLSMTQEKTSYKRKVIYKNEKRTCKKL